MKFLSGLFLIGISLLFLSNSIFFVSIPSTSSDGFSLSVLGYYGETQFVPGPHPPNYTEVVTWDCMGYSQLVIRLTYHGSSPCEVISLRLWHEVTFGGVTWNYSDPVSISPPSYSLSTSSSFDFLVEGCFVYGVIWLAITTSSDTFCVSTFVGAPSRITTWPLSTLPASRSVFTPGLLYLSFFPNLFVLILYRKKKGR